MGFKVLFVLQPMGVCLERPQEYKFPMLEQPEAWHITYYRALYAEIEAQLPRHPGVSVVNLCRALNEPVEKRGWQPFNTQIHLNSDGNRFMARILLDLISGFFPIRKDK